MIELLQTKGATVGAALRGRPFVELTGFENL